ncbi:hypothetical protein RD1_2110 [Roseobacter denitrificans OCh 114]|uniref:Uncharacterized protein n=1 Tax=Roseobacter denitrificans (strain ATCC 33942 / OCh 114) TaxID=375451 RepID=Q167Y4_ROSDO|nr:hypothetical protein RD1_2110 [Roseobacter denitrificans OCh 114]
MHIHLADLAFVILRGAFRAHDPWDTKGKWRNSGTIERAEAQIKGEGGAKCEPEGKAFVL